MNAFFAYQITPYKQYPCIVFISVANYTHFILVAPISLLSFFLHSLASYMHLPTLFLSRVHEQVHPTVDVLSESLPTAGDLQPKVGQKCIYILR